MRTLSYFNFVLAALFAAFCCYQIVYLVVRLLGKRRYFQAKKQCRYGVLIAARNEEAVIAQLIESIKAQDYPSELVDIFVVADNCTDATAQVARDSGATVFERENKVQVGKGYALNFLLEQIHEAHGDASYDGYFVFDADNLLDPSFITEMNKVFSSGNRVVTSYRNTKNYGDNWITAGYGLYFLRESEYLNRSRDYLRTSCSVSGTGFLFAESVLKEVGGWNYFLLTEDLQFSADMIARGEKIAYCRDAIIYDEQPTGLRESILQRSRWMKGYMQVLGKHGGDLVKTMAETGNFGCYDNLMNAIPVIVVTLLGFVLNSVMFIVGMATARQEMGIFFGSLLIGMVNSYGMFFAMGLLTTCTEWKRIHCSAKKKILYLFTFPVFYLSFGLSMVLALFGNVEWKPIKHTVAISIGDIGGNSRK